MRAPRRPLAVAVRATATARAHMAMMMVRLRSRRSPNIARSAAETATPNVDALIVSPTLASEAWKNRDSKGSRGCVQYSSRNENIPHRKTANTAPAGPKPLFLLDGLIWGDSSSSETGSKRDAGTHLFDAAYLANVAELTPLGRSLLGSNPFEFAPIAVRAENSRLRPSELIPTNSISNAFRPDALKTPQALKSGLSSGQQMSDLVTFSFKLAHAADKSTRSIDHTPPNLQL